MSSLGQSLLNARKNAGLTQEAVAEHLGVSRQTISKWELDETLPDIRQAKALSGLYHTTLDELIDYDAEVQEIQRIVRHTSEENQQKIHEIQKLIHLRKTEPALRSLYFHFPEAYDEPRMVQYINIDQEQNKIELLLNCTEEPVTVKGEGKILFQRQYQDGRLEPKGVLIRRIGR